VVQARNSSNLRMTNRLRALSLCAVMLSHACVARAQTVAPSQELTGALLAKLFDSSDTLKVLRMPLADVKKAFSELRPVMAGFEHQLWAIRNSAGVEAVFVIAANATNDLAPADRVAAVEISLSTSSARRFRDTFEKISESLKVARSPWRCARDTVSPVRGAVQYVSFRAQWRADGVGVALSATVAHGMKREIAATKVPGFRLQLRSFLLSDELISPTVPPRTDTNCVFSRSDISNGFLRN
jgi:hypothetical protein